MNQVLDLLTEYDEESVTVEHRELYDRMEVVECTNTGRIGEYKWQIELHDFSDPQRPNVVVDLEVRYANVNA
jgi:hypothetical protein